MDSRDGEAEVTEDKPRISRAWHRVAKRTVWLCSDGLAWGAGDTTSEAWESYLTVKPRRVTFSNTTYSVSAPKMPPFAALNTKCWYQQIAA